MLASGCGDDDDTADSQNATMTSGEAMDTTSATGTDEGTGGVDATGEGDGGMDGETTAATDGGAEGGDDCLPNETDPTQYVIVGFWNGDPSCSGDPIQTNAFPVQSDAPCYCWPGNSGMNSADGFMCDPQAGSFTYIQYNSLTCSAGDDTPTEKTTFLDSCTQDIPMNLYSKIVDFGACGG